MNEDADYQPLDGNAAAGLLRELFALEMTEAEITCDNCGSVGAIGGARVYGGAMGAIFRCVNCDAVVVRLVRTPAGLWLEMQGTRRLFVRAAS
jgi:Family of unknown function (DUF6510)